MRLWSAKRPAAPASFHFQAANTVDNDCYFVLRERRPAARFVPSEQKFQCDKRVDVAPQQMSGQASDRIVALAFPDTVADKITPTLRRRSAVSAFGASSWCNDLG